ncbi:hypothetical protein J8L88_16760 [Aquimarina sp. MMG015]|uniref:tail fiber protein n=1 Tax=Aquimarina sp. MMG015 TaxID=2822689 RepID=UPI001B3A2FDF|nr:tail fiber protein [Aquimarina sp. MMG015]MBQ4804514.1 hypothetical protein [Aquimarina sp. MMG015]
MKKITILVTLIGISLGANSQHNYDNQNMIYSNIGKVGIGTNTPSEKLQIYDNVNGAVYLGVYNNNTSSNSISGIRLGMGTSYDIGTNLYHKRSDNTFYFENLGAPNSKFAFLTRKADGTYGISLKINENGNIGVGISNPNQKLEIFNPNPFNSNMEAESQDHISLSSNDPGNGNYFGGITWKTGDRRRASIVATREHSDSDYVGLAFFTKGTDGPGPIYESMRITRYGNVGIGTTNPDMKLTVKGNIHAEEVKIDLNIPAPDYVFKESYNLRSIEEVENFIKKNSHLPEIPSAKEFEQNGVMQAEMDMNLLKKIEELTLYTIDQEKKIKKLERKNEELNSINKKLIELQSRLEKLESKK